MEEMTSWNLVETEDDIELLLRIYHRFHDACIVSASYQSGTTVDHDGTMHYPSASGHNMTIFFQSQMALRTLELQFSGVRVAHLIGWDDNRFSEIFDATLSFAEGLLPGKPERLIAWAGCSEFDFKQLHNPLHEPASYIIANKLKWRFVQQD